MLHQQVFYTDLFSHAFVHSLFFSLRFIRTILYYKQSFSTMVVMSEYISVAAAVRDLTEVKGLAVGDRASPGSKSAATCYARIPKVILQPEPLVGFKLQHVTTPEAEIFTTRYNT
jgi:hypothetical protein